MKTFLLIVALVAAGLALVASLGDGAPLAAAGASSLRQPITAQAEMSAISDTLVARADYAAGSTIPVPSPSLDEAQPVVVALFVEQRGPVQDGSLIANVGGRPLFAFNGDIPMYRTLHPYDTGADVELIQRALIRVGHLNTDTKLDGVYGKTTMHAVEKLYEASGFEPVPGLSRGGERRGPTVRRGEIAFIPGLPGTVAAVNTEPGESVTESVISVADTDPELSFDTTVDNATALVTGQRVELSDSRTGFAATSAVTAIGEAEDGAVRVELEVPVGLNVDDVGRNFKAIVHLNEAAAVLNVPLGAILTDSDGSTYIHVLASDHEYFRLPVSVERVDLGRAVIAEGSLETGQLVIVGWYEP